MVKTLAKHIKEFKKDSILTPMYMVLEVIMETIIPLLMAKIIDDGINKGNMKIVYEMGGLMAVASVIGLFTGIMGGVYGARASAGFARNLRFAMFQNIQSYSFENIDKFSTAGLVTRLTTDITNIQNAYQMILRMCFRAPVSLICAMVMAFTINARLASIYLVAVIFLGIVLGFIVVNAMKFFNAGFRKYDDLNASVQENVSGIRVVKSFVREDYEMSKFKKASANVCNMFIKAENVLAFNAPAMQFTVYGCILLISWFGARMIVVDGLKTGDLVSLFAYCMNILSSLMTLSFVFVMISMSIASGERVAQVLNESATISNKENAVMTVPSGSISFRNVCFQYSSQKIGEGRMNIFDKEEEKTPENFSWASSGTDAEEADRDKYVLTDISCDIKAGETIGIIGGTGSSKSTFVNLISRLYDVSSGQVTVGGIDVRDYDIDTLRNHVAVVLQKNVLFSGTIYDNLRWGNPEATEEECVAACKLACADDFIRSFPDGYHTYIEQGGTNVSGGQKQRLCIARALLKKPKILILDDSTSAVDTATDAKIRKAFREKIPDTTKLIISQRISSVQDADRIIVLEDGHIEGMGTHEELLATNKIYKEVYISQTSGGGDFDENGGEL